MSLRRNGGLETKLQLGLSRANEGFEDGRMFGIKDDVSADRVREALEGDVLVERVAESLTKLL